METQIPLHLRRPSGSHYGIGLNWNWFFTKEENRQRVLHAFKMCAMTGGKGFRQYRDHFEFIDQRMDGAGMTVQPYKQTQREIDKAERKASAKAEHLAAVRNDPTRGLSNYELIRFNAARRQARGTGQDAPNPADYVGIRARVMGGR